ncbi:Neutral/alkaline nonlysosomal ceramidase [Stachybotrys elegans]|uniref:Neutral ceramidase n=1 Tax=Stachybotrys elegans TaxID=80388 RepID=A0A8K0WVB8_9HYPO|nr:Neutral/alkaline nonlysosomal ceramidase [Stachybotrys elegans]
MVTFLLCLFTWLWYHPDILHPFHDGLSGGIKYLSGLPPDDHYLLGVGKADITGPVVEINMMGYADPKQLGTGLRQRLYCRSFIVGSLENPSDRFVYLVLDTQSGDTAVRYGILSGLQDMGRGYAMYGHDNIAVTGTHSHSGPGAWLNYLLPQITSKGFDQQSYRAIVDGCLLSIRRAHESLQPGTLAVGTTKVQNANINRSLYAYLANPEEERSRYNASAEDDGSVEKDLTMLTFQRASDGKNIGILTWFPTHGTSMLGNNTLISGDNKGVAADLFEKHIRKDSSATEDFVAGFSQANMGDVSPNVLGAWCEDGSGQMCSFENSTCSDGKNSKCHARGPMFRVPDNGASSCFEIGKRQYEAALRLYTRLDRSSARLRGSGGGGSSVKAVHSFHDMSNFTFTLRNGTQARTCPAALGYSFAAGTSDGPGAFGFRQHDSDPSNTSPMWNAVSRMLKDPSESQVACHYPKPILLDVGEVQKPYAWTPNIVDIQLFRVGPLFIIVSPGEATTMAGRRWKEAIAQQSAGLFAKELDDAKPIVVIGGPANSYTHYIATEEEYGIQRYEGASTLYGPHTLEAYIDRSVALLPYLGYGMPPELVREPGPLPPDNSNRSMSFIPGVVYDGKPWGRSHGDVVTDVGKAQYARGETVYAVFVGANPRNNLRLEQTYAAVERRRPEDGTWETERDDSDWGLVFHWSRKNKLLGTSEAVVAWEIEEDAADGVYRLRYFGDAKAVGGEVTAFTGVSSSFRVT